eukprot:g1149.t1
MEESNRVVEQLGKLAIAPEGFAPAFWKPWAIVEKKAPAEIKDDQFVRVSAGFVNLGLEGSDKTQKEATSRRRIFVYLLKSFSTLNMGNQYCNHAPSQEPYARPLKLDYTIQKVLWLRDRTTRGKEAILEFKAHSQIIDIRCEGWQVKVHVAALDGVHCGRQSDIFGLEKWVFSLRFKSNRHRPLHFALPNQNILCDLTESLRMLIAPPSSKVASSSQPSPSFARTQEVKQNVRFVNLHTLRALPRISEWSNFSRFETGTLRRTSTSSPHTPQSADEGKQKNIAVTSLANRRVESLNGNGTPTIVAVCDSILENFTDFSLAAFFLIFCALDV